MSRNYVIVLTVIATCATGGCTSRPAESAIRECLGAKGGISVQVPTREPFGAAMGIRESATLRTIDSVAYGASFSSQGGLLELAVGAPKDTRIYPVRVFASGGGLRGASLYWIFKDSMNQLKCEAAPNT